MKIQGKRIPVRMTMGALLSFKEKTGKDVSELTSLDTTGMLVLILCCIESVCRADGIELEGVDMTHLADYITSEEMSAMAKDLLSADGEGNASRPAKRVKRT